MRVTARLTGSLLGALLILQARRTAADGGMLLHGCTLANVSQLPFCNTSLGFEARALDLRQRLTLQERVCMMNARPSGSGPKCSGSGGVPRLGLPGYNWAVEDLHGAGIQCLNGSTDPSTQHCPTIFPTLAVLAASFNESVWERTGTVIGMEMRAANNAGGRRARHPGNKNVPIGVNGWGPNLNIARDPRWGRNSEVPSEDPFLAGKLGAAMTRGIQTTNGTRYNLLLGALKHVTAYSLDSWQDDTGGPNDGQKYSRFGFNGNISLHDLAETYLEQFRIPITEANALGMMCSYSAVNGTASCENGHLLTTWARESLGFQGNVVTDCGALSMSSEPSDLVASAADALGAGTDLNCGNVYGGSLLDAINAGKAQEAMLNASVERSFKLLMQAGYFDPPAMVRHAQIPPEAVGSAASHALAKDAAVQGLVLLRNENGALPLKKGQRVAVIGPMANATLGLVNRYYDAVCPGPLMPQYPWTHGERSSSCIVSPVHAIMARGSPATVTHSSGWTCRADRPGDHCLTQTSQDGFAAAVAAAKAAERIVMFVGTDSNTESEGKDRQALTLPGAQPELLAAVRAAAPTTPVTVVLMNGGAIALNYTDYDAVVEAFFPGIEGAEAIACALYNEPGCNRWGRMPVTILPESFQHNDMANMGVSTGGSGLRTYKYYDGAFGQPLFQFGFGLSYSKFAVKWAHPPPSTPTPVSTRVNSSVTVTAENLGPFDGDLVLMMFHYPRAHRETLRDLAEDTPVPQRKLAGYRRTFLQAGQSANITFTVTADSLALFDNQGDAVLPAGTHDVHVWDGTSNDLSQSFVVDDTTVLRKLHW